MQKYDAIEKAILKKDVDRLREAMGDICYTNRSFSDGEFDQVLNYICSKGIDILDSQLNGKLISDDKTEYSDDDFARAVFELKKNFCTERINDVKKIGTVLYKPINQIEKPRPAFNSGTVPNSPSRRKLTNQSKRVILAAGIIILIVLLLLVMK